MIVTHWNSSHPNESESFISPMLVQLENDTILSDIHYVNRQIDFLSEPVRSTVPVVFHEQILPIHVVRTSFDDEIFVERRGDEQWEDQKEQKKSMSHDGEAES